MTSNIDITLDIKNFKNLSYTKNIVLYVLENLCYDIIIDKYTLKDHDIKNLVIPVVYIFISTIEEIKKKTKENDVAIEEFNCFFFFIQEVSLNFQRIWHENYFVYYFRNKVAGLQPWVPG